MTRHDRIPNANSPQLLTRMLEQLARGLRSTRGLQEALGVDLRTIQYYTQAADWLGFVESEEDLALTGLGLEYVFSGRDRPAVYARAVWAIPFVAELLGGTDTLPTADDIARAVRAADPDLAPTTARRRASAVRSLIAPALRRRPKPPPPDLQLHFPFAVGTVEDLPPLNLATTREYNPDVYRYLLCCLLDYGELSLGQVRALLDRAGASSAPIGGYIDMAVSRGDVKRLDERLVVTREAVARRGLVETTTSVMLSDPGYRSYLRDCAAAGSDRKAAVRRDKVASRYRPWDRRLFGRPVDPDNIEADLERVLLERPLSTFPVANASNIDVLPVHEPFLDAWEARELAICLPPALVQLQGGVPAINRMLRALRQGDTVGVPDPVQRPVLFHGSLLHPGEPLPRSVPDTRSMRLRVLMQVPYASLLAALLLLHRYRPEKVSVSKQKGRWTLLHANRDMGNILDVIDAFADERGWICSRRPTGGLRPSVLVSVLESIGIATELGPHLLLAERLFIQLRSEAEEMEVHANLAPLAETFDAWLEWADPVDD